MSEAVAKRRPGGGGPAALGERRRFTVGEYDRMTEAGIFRPNERVELLGGEIYAMAAMGSRHAGRISFLSRWLMTRLAGRAIVRVELPLHLPAGSEPEPDLAVVRLRPGDPDYDRGHPGPADVLLLIEIADTSLAYDRDLKLPLYAEAGVPEVWLVDLTSNTVLVHRAPSATGYGSVATAARDGTLTPATFPDLRLPVRELLPG